jgi:hypothetical protein
MGKAAIRLHFPASSAAIALRVVAVGPFGQHDGVVNDNCLTFGAARQGIEQPDGRHAGLWRMREQKRTPPSCEGGVKWWVVGGSI